MKLTKLSKAGSNSSLINLINNNISQYNKVSTAKNPRPGERILELTLLQELVSELAAAGTANSEEIHQLLTSIENDIRDICIAANLTQIELLIEHFADPDISPSSSSKLIDIDKMKLPFYQAIRKYAKETDKNAKASFLKLLQNMANGLKSFSFMENQERMKLEGQKVGLLLHQQEKSLTTMERKHKDITINHDDENVKRDQLMSLGQDLEEALLAQDDGSSPIKVKCLGVGNNRVYRISIKKDGENYSYACTAAAYDEEDKEVDKAIAILKQSKLAAQYIASPIDSIMLPGASARYFLFAWYEQGDVERYLVKMTEKGAPPLKRLAKAVGFIQDITNMIDAFRKDNVLMSDIKPANLLIDDNGSISLTDWKSLAPFDPEVEQKGQLRWQYFSSMTDAYSPPERLDKNGPPRCPDGEKIQIYSLGISFYQAVLGISSETLKNIAQYTDYDENGYKQFDFSDPIFTENENLGREIQSLILDMTQQDYNKRPTIQICQVRLDSIMEKIVTLKKAHVAAPVEEVSSKAPIERIDLTQIKKTDSQERELLRSRGSLKKQNKEDLTRFIKKSDSKESNLVNSSPLRNSSNTQSRENLNQLENSDAQANETSLRSSQTLPSSQLKGTLQRQSAKEDLSKLTLKSSHSGNLKSSGFFSTPNQQHNSADQTVEEKKNIPDSKSPKR